jgi:hypothetical protein
LGELISLLELLFLHFVLQKPMVNYVQLFLIILLILYSTYFTRTSPVPKAVQTEAPVSPAVLVLAGFAYSSSTDCSPRSPLSSPAAVATPSSCFSATPSSPLNLNLSTSLASTEARFSLEYEDFFPSESSGKNLRQDTSCIGAVARADECVEAKTTIDKAVLDEHSNFSEVPMSLSEPTAVHSIFGSQTAQTSNFGLLRPDLCSGKSTLSLLDSFRFDSSSNFGISSCIQLDSFRLADKLAKSFSPESNIPSGKRKSEAARVILLKKVLSLSYCLGVRETPSSKAEARGERTDLLNGK